MTEIADLARRARTVLLLESRGSWLPGPRSQFASFGAVPGELPTVRRGCRSCHGLGRVAGRRGPEPCVRCGGRGSYLVDAYTGARPVDAPLAPLNDEERLRWLRSRSTLAQLEKVNRQLERPPEVHSAADVADVKPYGWEAARDRHYRHGDYRALDLALEWLSGVDPDGRALIGWAFDAEVVPVSGRVGRVVDKLAARLPDPIRVPAWVLPDSPGLRRIRDRQRREAG